MTSKTEDAAPTSHVIKGASSTNEPPALCCESSFDRQTSEAIAGCLQAHDSSLGCIDRAPPQSRNTSWSWAPSIVRKGHKKRRKSKHRVDSSDPTDHALLDQLHQVTDLDVFLECIHLPMLFDDVSKSSPCRQHLFDLLLSRVDTVSAEVLAAVLDAVQRSKCGEAARDFVTQVFLSCTGAKLHDLTHALDREERNMCLTVHDFLEESQQTKVIAHLREQLSPSDPPHLHILTDIDDTFVHSGYGLGGPKYPKNTVMPGILALFEVLQAHVVFVTARPSWVQNFTRRQIQKKFGLTDVTILSGKLRDSLLIPFKKSTANRLISRRKINNFAQYEELFPACSFMWFGDSGQSDIQCGLGMKERTDERILGIYIQDVAKSNGCQLKSCSTERSQLSECGVLVVDNYVQVAVDIHENHPKYLTAEGLQHIVRCAVRDLVVAEPRFEDALALKMRWLEMESQVALANAALNKAGINPVNIKLEREHVEGLGLYEA